MKVGVDPGGPAHDEKEYDVSCKLFSFANLLPEDSNAHINHLKTVGNGSYAIVYEFIYIYL